MIIGTIVIIIIYLILSLVFINKKLFHELMNCLYWFLIGFWHISYYIWIDYNADRLKVSVFAGCIFVFIGILRSIGYIVKYYDD